MRDSYEYLISTEMKSVYPDLIDQLIFSGHQLVFSAHQFLKISMNRYTDFPKLACIEIKSVYTDLIDLLIFRRHPFAFSAHQFLKISVNTDTPVFENLCEQIHWFSFYQSDIKLVIRGNSFPVDTDIQKAV